MKKSTLFVCLSFCCYSQIASALSVAPPWDSFVYTFDKNADNRLSMPEFLAVKKENADALVWNFDINQQTFKRMDKNRNGFLEPEEIDGVGYSERVNQEIQCWPMCEP